MTLDTERLIGMWGRGLQHASDLLIKRGTAMGPMIPLLFLVPVLIGATWLFRGFPAVAILFGVAAVGIVVEYCRQYSRFAKNDPDRLQSEQFRYEMKKIHMVAAKELPYAIPAESLSLPEATSNPAHPLPEVSDSLAIDGHGDREGEK